MTAATVPADIVPPRSASRSLLWIVPPTLLWTLLIYLQPAISASGVPTAAVRLMTYGLVGIGLWLGACLLIVARSFTGTLTVPLTVYAIGFAWAVVLALAGGAMAGWRALRLRVVDALAAR